MHTPTIQSAVQELQQQKQQAILDYQQSRQPAVFFERYVHSLNTLLTSLWQENFAHSGCALLAIGGFGRSEMYPHSDLDLAFVSPASLDEKWQEAVGAFVQTLWDTQLAPAVKVGSVEELCQSANEDLTADTAFLEARFICGDHKLANHFQQQLSLQRDTALFIEGKLLEMQQRHDKQQGSGAVLEPNVKTCPGGLRDIHTMMWLAKAQGIGFTIDA